MDTVARAQLDTSGDSARRHAYTVAASKTSSNPVEHIRADCQTNTDTYTYCDTHHYANTQANSHPDTHPNASTC